MSEIAKYYCPYCKHKDDKSDWCDSCHEISEGDIDYMSGYFPNNDILNLTIATDMKNMDDPVNHPTHYQTKTGLETIEVIEAFTDGLEGIEAVCTANVIKYICRWKKKNGLQDLKKARWYLGYLIEHVEKSAEDAECIKRKAVKIKREATLGKLRKAADLVFDAWEKYPDELMNYHGNFVDFLKEKNKEEKENK